MTSEVLCLRYGGIFIRHITVKDMECLKEAFALFDRDRDGEINTDELGKARDASRPSSCSTWGL